MVTGISHDLRTPLTSIRGYIKGVLDGVANTEDKRTMYLETAYESTEDMNILLQKLFDFSRMESGQMPVHMIQIDLAEYVQGFTAQKEKTLDPSEVQLVMEQEGLTQPDYAAKPDTAAQPDDVSQPNTAAQPGEQDAKKEDSDEEQNEQL